MKRRIFLSLVSSLAMLGASAQIAAPETLQDFEKRKAEINRSEYFDIFTKPLSDEQRQALQAMYAYMPLPDISDHSGDYFLENVNVALQARKEMPWGKMVPDREFRHFVLPVRVNNESLDDHRKVFYEELKDRVKDLSMKDAILEVNHWCHEKATYQPSDSRTHNPLATVSSAIGRCGEESTFLVAALRAIGIPARQVYTPRWAHTDDNHAWVEAWADGKWYFLGACEPEPVLNLGWFNSPASRGVLMNSRVFGNYNGEEETLLKIPGYTDINVTANYAPVSTVNVKVVDKKGKPVKDAKVNYCLYNYAEYYPIATKTSDANGMSSLNAGKGDIIVWASDGKNYGLKKVSVGRDNQVVIALDCNSANKKAHSYEFDLVPPPVTYVPEQIDPAKVAENDRRKVYEDSLRNAYTATFIGEEQAKALASELSLDATRLASVLADARGNHPTVIEFLRATPASDRQRALRLLEVISQKDRCDITMDVLKDQMLVPVQDSPYFDEYILSPRVINESLNPFYSNFIAAFPADSIAYFKNNPSAWTAYVAKNIELCTNWQPRSVRMDASSVLKSKMANVDSRDIFFVRGARAIGIPAQIDPITGKTQMMMNGEWSDIEFEKAEAQPATAKTGVLKMTFSPMKYIDDPRYYYNFSISKIEDGIPMLLNYDDEATWSHDFKDGIRLDEGEYILTTGQRIADGSVLVRSDIFTITSGKTTTLPLQIRHNDNAVQVIGNFDSENLYHDLATGTDKSFLSTTGRGYYVLGIISANHEPTNHALRDIAAVSDKLEKWGQKIVLLYKDENTYASMDKSLIPELPSTAVFGIDIEGSNLKEIVENMHLPSSELPVFIVADTFNRIVFISQGYTIGLGDQIVKILPDLK